MLKETGDLIWERAVDKWGENAAAEVEKMNLDGDFKSFYDDSATPFDHIEDQLNQYGQENGVEVYVTFDGAHHEAFSMDKQYLDEVLGWLVADYSEGHDTPGVAAPTWDIQVYNLCRFDGDSPIKQAASS